MDSSRVTRAVDEMRRGIHGITDVTQLRVAALAVLRRHVGFDGFVWVLTDPVTAVGSAPYATIPAFAELPEVIRVKYTAAPHRWTSIDRARQLVEGGVRPGGAWSDLLGRHAVTDVASAVHRDRFGVWAFLDLWRSRGIFSMHEMAVLDGVGPALARGLRECQALTMTVAPARTGREGPVLVLVDDRLAVAGDTAEATEWLARLLPPAGAGSAVPAVVYNVAAQLLARESGHDDHPPYARAHLGDGRWISVRAARLHGRDAAGLIGVSLEEAAPLDRLEVYGLAYGLSERERELVGLLAHGHDTAGVALRMFLSPHTVQDHLKSVFAKTGVRSRGALLSRALGVSGSG